MSVSTVRVCDRCAHEEKSGDLADWLLNVPVSQRFTSTKHVDLCQFCTQEFGEWMKSFEGVRT